MKKKLDNIKNIIFDLGEVIVDLDLEKTQSAFHNLLGIDPDILYNLKGQKEMFDHLEVNKTTENQFREELRKLGNKKVSNEQLDAAWNAMLTGIPKRKVELVQNLRLSYQTFVLSNTNSIHIDYLNQNLLLEHGVESLDEIFDHVYYSHSIGFRKPDPKAYCYVLNKHHLLVEKTLFIDDRIENIISAEKLGIRTWHLKNREDLYEIL